MSRNIFPAGLASMFAASSVGKKFRPSNGTEGELFIAAWCHNCKKDSFANESCDSEHCHDQETCQIIGDTMLFDVEDEGYPSEWTYGTDGQPRCTAFISIDSDETTTPRCNFTADMFADSGVAG